MTAPVIRQYPGTIPDKGQTQTAFDTNVDAFLDWQALQFAPDLVAFGTWTNGVANSVLATALAGDLPPLTGEAGRFIRVKAAEDGVEFTADVAPLAGPTFTGVPSGPTAASGTDTTQLATTAFVQARSSGGTPAAVNGLVTKSYAIPAGVQEITVHFVGVSTDSFFTDSSAGVQLGLAGGIVTSGYVSISATMDRDDRIAVKNAISHFLMAGMRRDNRVHGSMVLRRLGPSSNVWTSTHAARVSDDETISGGGSVTLSGEVTTVEISPYFSSDEFDAGTINVTWRY